MKNVILFLTIIIIMFSSETFAQDINTIFNNKLTLDTHLSNQSIAINALMSYFDEVRTKIYSYDGSFEEAVNDMKVPQNSDVGTVNNQPLGINFSMFIMFTEDIENKPFSDEWYKKAWEKVEDLANKQGKSLSVTINSLMMQRPENLRVGEKVETRMIILNNPYVDLDNLKVIEGTWVSDIVGSTFITAEMLDNDSEGFEDEWEEQEMDLEIDLPTGAHFVKFDDVADSELLTGDVNYVVEISTDQVINFFRKNKVRYINSFEQSELDSEDGDMITTFYLLKHEGDLKSGDDVLFLTIQPAPKIILSNVMGRNQGIWTMISINQWIEEEY